MQLQSSTIVPEQLLNQAVISAQHLNHYFGEGDLRKQALYDINLDIHAGEIIIMTGPSGSGKTTLLTLMGGLATKRSVFQYFSNALLQRSLKQRSHIT